MSLTPMLRRLATVAVLLIGTFLGAGTAAAADGVSSAQRRAAREYLAAVASGSPQNLAFAIHPADLEALRTRLLTQMREEAKRGESTIRGRLFGAAMPLADIERLTSIDFYGALARRLTLTGREYSDQVWLGVVPDRGDAVNVVLRGKQPKGRGDVQVVQVVTLKPYGKDWKAALPGELEAQIDDLVNGRRTPTRQAASTAASRIPAGSPPAVPAEVPAAISSLLSSAESALAASKCEEYYQEYMSPNFRRMTASSALESLVGACERSLGTREMLLSTVKIVRELQPRYEYQGQRAVYDVSGQGLPFDRFVLEQVDKRWYIAE